MEDRKHEHGDLERRTFPVAEARVTRDEDGTPTEIVTDVAVFDSLSEDLGGFVERIEPGALSFDEDVTSEFNHDPSRVLGRRSAGTLEIEESDESVTFRVDPPDTSYARDLAESIDRGDVQGGSFTFVVPEGGDEFISRKDEPDLRVIKDATVFEGGPVTHPAYRDTNTELRDTTVAERRHRQFCEAECEDEGESLRDATRAAIAQDPEFRRFARDLLAETEDRQKRPTFDGTEDIAPEWADGEWGRPNLSDHPEADGEWDELDDDARDAIRGRFIEQSGDTYGDLGFPVVNPATDRLNRNGLLAARQRGSGEVEQIADALWEEHFADDEEENAVDIGTLKRKLKLAEMDVG